MLRFREPSKDGPAATRVKTTRGHQVLPGRADPSSPHSSRGSLFEIPTGGILRVRKGAAVGFPADRFGSRGSSVGVVGS